MRLDGPGQAESLAMIKVFLRCGPTRGVGQPDRHPGQRPDRPPSRLRRPHRATRPGTVFPLAVLRELAAEGRIRLAAQHYAFTGATSEVGLRTQVAPEWARRLPAKGMDAGLLVAARLDD